jgi:4-amino-4-deoxy-L-arabinose transferase-like glycosyltransferase
LTLRRAVLALIAALAIFTMVDNLGRPLAHPDEGRYAEISREMAASGDWVTPRLNGIKYFEKPPLQYWAGALSLKLLGVNEAGARLYTVMCGLIALLAVFVAARRWLTPDGALLSVAVLLSSPYFLGLAGVVTLDMGLTAWTTVAACALLVAMGEASPVKRRRWMLLAWAGMALAVLSKGLVGLVFPAAAVFLLCLVQRDWRLLGQLEWLRGLALFLAIAAPWFVLVSRANPEFAHFFFVHEHFERFLTRTHRRSEPAWYFLPILFAGFLPWMLTLLPAAWDGWRREATREAFPWRRFALRWSGFILAFFSASGSKLPAYILPAFPLLALVVGDWLSRIPGERLWKFVAPVAAVATAGIALAWGLPDRAKDDWMRGLYEAARPWMAAGLAILAAGLAGAAWKLRAGRKHGGIALVVIASIAFVDLVEDGFVRLAPRQSGKDSAAVLRPHIGPATRLYAVEHYDQTLPFYLGRTFTLVNYVDEFALGLARQPHLAIATREAFLADWARPGEAVAIIQPGHYEAYLGHGLAMTLLARDERRALVKKP